MKSLKYGLTGLFVVGICLSWFVVSSMAVCPIFPVPVKNHVFVKFNDPGSFRDVDTDERSKLQSERLNALSQIPDVDWVKPLFTRPTKELLEEHKKLDADCTKALVDLTTWIRIGAKTLALLMRSRKNSRVGATYIQPTVRPTSARKVRTI